MENILAITIGAVFVNNVVLSQFLGLCPFLGVSKKIETAFGMGCAVIFVLTSSSFVTSIVYHYILIKFDVTFLSTIVFILIIAGFVQFVEMFLRKKIPTLYRGLGVFLPLITTNCAVLGVAFINVNNSYTVIESVINGFFTSLGFLVTILIFAGIREKIEYNNIPSVWKGTPISLIIAGLMAMVFYGFSGLL